MASATLWLLSTNDLLIGLLAFHRDLCGLRAEKPIYDDQNGLLLERHRWIIASPMVATAEGIDQNGLLPRDLLSFVDIYRLALADRQREMASTRRGHRQRIRRIALYACGKWPWLGQVDLVRHSG